ncbi:hypothetical protein Tco_1392457 [Tanacetum coccineum]
MADVHVLEEVTNGVVVTPLPLLEELSRAADSYMPWNDKKPFTTKELGDICVTKDQLKVLFEREVAEDARKVREFHRLSSELREAVRRGDGYIIELRMSRSYDDARGTIKMMRRMLLDDMEKASRLLLMARET